MCSRQRPHARLVLEHTRWQVRALAGPLGQLGELVGKVEDQPRCLLLKPIEGLPRRQGGVPWRVRGWGAMEAVRAT
jgi:hypothetical protein